MKNFKLITLVSLASGITCSVHGAYMTPQIQQLLNQKEAKVTELEKCDSKRKGFMIAGISTLGLTAVGIGGNIALARQNKKLNTQLDDVRSDLSAKQGQLAGINDQISRAQRDKAKEDCEYDGNHTYTNEGDCIEKTTTPVNGGVITVGVIGSECPDKPTGVSKYIWRADESSDTLCKKSATDTASVKCSCKIEECDTGSGYKLVDGSCVKQSQSVLVGSDCKAEIEHATAATYVVNVSGTVKCIAKAGDTTTRNCMCKATACEGLYTPDIETGKCVENSVKKCIADRKDNPEGQACCYLKSSVATFEGGKCKCVGDKEFKIEEGVGKCVDKVVEVNTDRFIGENCLTQDLGPINATSGKYVQVYKLGTGVFSNCYNDNSKRTGGMCRCDAVTCSASEHYPVDGMCQHVKLIDKDCWTEDLNAINGMKGKYISLNTFKINNAKFASSVTKFECVDGDCVCSVTECKPGWIADVGYCREDRQLGSDCLTMDLPENAESGEYFDYSLSSYNSRNTLVCHKKGSTSFTSGCGCSITKCKHGYKHNDVLGKCEIACDPDKGLKCADAQCNKCECDAEYKNPINWNYVNGGCYTRQIGVDCKDHLYDKPNSIISAGVYKYAVDGPKKCLAENGSSIVDCSCRLVDCTFGYTLSYDKTTCVAIQYGKVYNTGTYTDWWCSSFSGTNTTMATERETNRKLGNNANGKYCYCSYENNTGGVVMDMFDFKKTYSDKGSCEAACKTECGII